MRRKESEPVGGVFWGDGVDDDGVGSALDVVSSHVFGRVLETEHAQRAFANHLARVVVRVMKRMSMRMRRMRRMRRRASHLDVGGCEVQLVAAVDIVGQLENVHGGPVVGGIQLVSLC